MNYGLRALLNLAGRISNVRFAHDIVAREHSVCLVAGNFSRGLLWDSTANHVPHSGAAKIMEQQSGQSGSFGERVPRSAKVADRLPVSGKEKIFGLLPFPQFRHKQAAFLGECHGTAFSHALRAGGSAQQHCNSLFWRNEKQSRFHCPLSHFPSRWPPARQESRGRRRVSESWL